MDIYRMRRWSRKLSVNSSPEGEGGCAGDTSASFSLIWVSWTVCVLTFINDTHVCFWSDMPVLCGITVTRNVTFYYHQYNVELLRACCLFSASWSETDHINCIWNNWSLLISGVSVCISNNPVRSKKAERLMVRMCILFAASDSLFMSFAAASLWAVCVCCTVRVCVCVCVCVYSWRDLSAQPRQTDRAWTLSACISILSGDLPALSLPLTNCFLFTAAFALPSEDTTGSSVGPAPVQLGCITLSLSLSLNNIYCPQPHFVKGRN